MNEIPGSLFLSSGEVSLPMSTDDADIGGSSLSDSLATMVWKGRRWVRIWHQGDREAGRAGGSFDAAAVECPE